MITVKKGKNYDQLNNEFIIRFGFAYLNNIVEQRFKKKDKVVIIIGTDGVKEHKKLLEILNKMLIMFKRVNVIYHYNVSLPFAKFFQRKMKAEALIYIGHNNSDFKYSNLIIYNENNQLISRIIADKLEFNTNKTVNNPDKKIIKQILKTRIVRSFEIPYKQICDYFKEFNFEKIKVKKMPAVHRRVGLVAFGGTGRWLNILKSRLLANGIELVNINYASYQNILLNGAFNIAMVRDLTFNPTFTSQYARLWKKLTKKRLDYLLFISTDGLKATIVNPKTHEHKIVNALSPSKLKFLPYLKTTKELQELINGDCGVLSLILLLDFSKDLN